MPSMAGHGIFFCSSVNSHGSIKGLMTTFNSCPWSLVWLPILKYGGIHLPFWGIIIYILKWHKILSICQEIVDYGKIMIVTKKKEKKREATEEIKGNREYPLTSMFSFADVFPDKSSWYCMFERSVWPWKQEYWA